MKIFDRHGDVVSHHWRVISREDGATGSAALEPWLRQLARRPEGIGQTADLPLLAATLRSVGYGKDRGAHICHRIGLGFPARHSGEAA